MDHGDHGVLSPTCVLKVNLGCCNACVVKLKKLLWKIDEVEAVDVDVEKGLVTVTGKVDPETLIKKIANKKKKAELVSYDDLNKNKDDKRRRDHKKKHHPLDHSDHELEDYVPPPKLYDDPECRDRHCQLHRRNSIIQSGRINNFVPPMINSQPPWSRPRLPPPPSHHYLPPIPHYPPHHNGAERRLSEPINGPLPRYHDRGFSYQRAPPPPQPYWGYYGARNVPATNDITHYFSDENATGCSIM